MFESFASLQGSVREGRRERWSSRGRREARGKGGGVVSDETLQVEDGVGGGEGVIGERRVPHLPRTYLDRGWRELGQPTWSVLQV